MKTHLPLLWAIGLAGMIAMGCGKTDPQKTATPPEKGTVQTAVDGFTGKTTIDIGLRAKEQINKAHEKEMKDINEAMQ